ncbi:hypothetical protein FRC12_017815 [Ceratobasidium sp. 428]|nr:hypothetical protein FRC12_017815 [Ceratobasidium sp. 428]
MVALNANPIVVQPAQSWQLQTNLELFLCENDYSLGPWADCRAWDLTLGFERGILTVVPDVVFTLVALLRIWYLLGQTTKLTRPSHAQCALKLLSVLVLLLPIAGLTIISWEHRTVLELSRNNPFLPTIPLVSSLLLATLVGLEHFRSLTPSTTVLSYTIFKALGNLMILRTYCAIGLPTQLSEDPLYALTKAATTGYVLLTIAESIEKRRLLKSPYDSYPAECSTSILSRSLYFWLLPLLWRGSRVKLGLDDLKDIPPDYKAVESRSRLDDALSKNKNLFRATIASYGGTFFSPVFPRLGLALATFSQPFLVEGILKHVQSDNPSPEQGWALIAGFFLVYAAIVFTTAVYWEKTFDGIVAFRGALVGSVLHKSLRLAAHEGRSIGGSTASTYISVDITRITGALNVFHEIWASAVAIVLGFAILYTKAQWAAFLPLLVIAITMGITSYCGNISRERQTVWLAATDKRMKLIGSMLSNSMPIKMSAYEIPFMRKVKEIRDGEMHGATRFFTMVVINVALSNAASTFCAVAVLAAYALMVRLDPSIGKFDAATIFTISATVQLLGMPLAFIGQALPSLFTGWASFRRIEAFLDLTERPETSVEDAFIHRPGQCNYDFKLSQASFTWEQNGTPVLKNIDFTLEVGKLYMCVGPVASGKTSLIASMLGETTLLSGSLATSPRRPHVGYAAQDAFIFPGTIRENIILGNVIDLERYQAVIAACGLEPDFARFPSGDMTRLADKGASLSGGQKQRVALARAVYSDTPVLFLDDPLSALDAATEEHVAQSLFDNSKLLKGRTVFITTHSVHHLPSADTVVVMDQGSVVFQGAYTTLQNEPTLLHLVQESSRSQAPAEKSSLDTNKDDKSTDQQTEGPDDETMQSYNQKGWHPYMFWTQMAGVHRVVVGLSTGALWMLIAVAMSLYLKSWSEHPDGNVPFWILGYCGLSALYLAVGIAAFWLWLKHANIVASTRIHEDQVKAVVSATPSYLQATPVGRLVNRFSQDISASTTVAVIVMDLPMSFFGMFLSAMSVASNLTFVLVATPGLTVSLPFLVAIYWLLIKFYLATSTQLQQLESASISPLLSSFGTVIAGLETIRSFGAQRLFGSRGDGYLDSSQGPLYFRYAGMRLLRTVLTVVTMFISVGLATLAVSLRSSTSAGLLGIALISMTKIASMSSQLLLSWGQVENGAVAVERLYEIVSLHAEPDLEKENNSATGDSWPAHGEIAFEGYTMSYSKELPPTLQNLTFKIPGGSRVGICGRTGSGKSSTVNALFRTVDSELVNGELLVDGVNIRDLSLKSLRSSLSIVPQDPFLWHSTIRENMDIEGLNSDAEIWQALDRVGMKDAVAALENSLDTVLQDTIAFSRGQRQLLCMARVLLRKRKIVILDEATSSMDPQTDGKVREIISEELQGCTVLSVAHRIATIVNFDLIIVLDDGKVAEIGPPQVLLADSSSKFSKLANSQGIYASETQSATSSTP